MEEDTRGSLCFESLKENNLIVLNENGPDPRAAENSRDSSPDVTVYSEDLAVGVEWDILPMKLSDHYPISIRMESVLE